MKMRDRDPGFEQASVLDIVQLDHNTFGDSALKQEILGLFLEQLDTSRRQLAAASEARDWQFAAHTLKGAAAAVGAVELAGLALAWERDGLPANPAAQAQVLAAFDAAAARLRGAVQQIRGESLSG